MGSPCPTHSPRLSTKQGLQQGARQRKGVQPAPRVLLEGGGAALSTPLASSLCFDSSLTQLERDLGSLLLPNPNCSPYLPLLLHKAVIPLALDGLSVVHPGCCWLHQAGQGQLWASGSWLGALLLAQPPVPCQHSKICSRPQPLHSCTLG